VLIHCRGGVGRAGTVAGCLLGHYCLKYPLTISNAFPKELSEKNVESIVKNIFKHVRKVRCAQAIESRRQEEFIRNYVLK
jgi:protein tyrosine phosphatase